MAISGFGTGFTNCEILKTKGISCLPSLPAQVPAERLIQPTLLELPFHPMFVNGGNQQSPNYKETDANGLY